MPSTNPPPTFRERTLVMQRTTTYREQSRRFLAQAYEELAKGDIPQTSEKAWGATAQMLKAIAQQRGWAPSNPIRYLYGTVIRRLRRETGDPELTDSSTQASGTFTQTSTRTCMKPKTLRRSSARDRAVGGQARGVAERNALVLRASHTPSHPKRTQKCRKPPPTESRAGYSWPRRTKNLPRVTCHKLLKRVGGPLQMLKAIAQQRGWSHRSHQSLYGIIRQLRRETGKAELTLLFSHASDLHGNFYENLYETHRRP